MLASEPAQPILATMATIPLQSEIAEYFASQPPTTPSYLVDLVDEVQEHFHVTPEDRKVKINGHGTEGTLLECLTTFALLRLKEQGIIKDVGANHWVKANSPVADYHIKHRDLTMATMDLRQLQFAGVKDRDEAIIMLLDKYNEATLLAASKKVFESV